MKNILLIIVIFFSVGTSFSQDWQRTKPNILFAVDKANNIFNVKVGIGTSNPRSPLDVKGQIISDSIRISKVLHIGDSSLVLQNNVTFQAATADQIRSSIGRIVFMRDPLAAATSSAINIGIGLQDPQNKLHIHEFKPINIGPPSGAFAQFTNSGGSTGGTGKLATDGVLFGVSPLGDGVMQQQEPNNSINIITVNNPVDVITNNIRKMRVWHDAANRPRVGIGAVTTPLSYLHLGLDPFGGTGHRPWMDKGMLIFGAPLTGTQGTDNMYVGLREYSFNRTDAIISWGNDPSAQSPTLTDRLRFVFTSFQPLGLPASGDATHVDGLEIVRMTSDGRNGFIGLGGDGFSNMAPPFPTPYNPYSNNNTDPGNTVEINSPVVNASSVAPAIIANTTSGYLAPNPNPAFAPATGISGLRFTDLTANSFPVPAGVAGTTTNVLSVDQNGDVILVPGGGGTALGGICGSSPAALTNHFEIPLATFNYIFSGQGNTGTNVGIGTGCSAGAKLDVLQINTNAGHKAIRGTANNSNGQVGVEGRVNGAAKQIAVRGTALTPTIGTANTGGDFLASGNGVNRGVKGRAELSSSTNIGGDFIASGTTGVRYGIRASSGTAPNYAGFFNGDVYSTTNSYTSDSILKENIVSIPDAIATLRQLQPHKFNFKTADFPYLNLPPENQYGLIAQEVERILPELIKEAINTEQRDTADNIISPPLTFKVLNYNGLIPISIQAIQQLDSSVTALQNAPAGISGSGTTNFLTKWSGANSVISSTVRENNGNVMIGNPSIENLDAERWLTIGGSDAGNILLINQAAGPGQNLGSLTFGNPGTNSNATGVAAINGVGDGTTTSGRLDFSTRATGGSKEVRMTVNGIGNVGIGTTAPTEKLHVAGNIFASGTITQNSDVRLKQNIAALSDGTGIINQLEPHTFNFDTAQYNWINLPGGKQHGLIAQEVEPLLPELITASFYPEVKDSAGNIIHPRVDYKGINYTALIPILIQAVKEQQAKIAELEATVSGCCTANAPKFSEGLRSTDAELASKSAVLWQNFPNPFGDGTVIRYYVPETTGSANIVFYDEFGNEIKNTELPYKGEKAELNLSTLNLASGIYSYSLIVNGKIVDTKRMIRAK